jgi:subtilisin family serine protease
MFRHLTDLFRRTFSGHDRQSQSRRPSFEVLEPRLLCSKTPNDPSFPNQYALTNIAATAAWDVTTGSRQVIVANIDTGIDYTHPDLYKNIWINQAEIPSAVRKGLVDTDNDDLITFVDLNAAANAGKFGVNDLNKNGYIDAKDLLAPYKKNGKGGWADGINGPTWTGETAYVDDIVGWDFANRDNDPFDHDGHGTETAGIIGASGNNGKGIAGVSWRVSLMALKIFRDTGQATADVAIAAAIQYSADAGAKISNNSWGDTGGQRGDVIYQAISHARAKGQLFIAAAGNDSLNNDLAKDRFYPASYDLSNIISVEASTRSGNLADYSNFGQHLVDIAAPGSKILSTLPNGKYGYASGTSFSSPFVAGAAALLLAQDGTRTANQIKTLIMNGADQSVGLLDTSVSGAQLNLFNALQGVAGKTA